MNTPEALLQVFHDTCIESVKTTPAKKAPELNNVLRVEAVAKYSIATLLGIQQGDLLVKVNHRNAAKVDMTHAAALTHFHNYTYYLSTTQMWLKLRTNGVPLGVDLQKPVQAIIHQYRSGDGDIDDLMTLWEDKEDKALLDLVSHWQKKGVLWLEKRVPKKFGHVFLLSSQEVLLVGVVLYEQGEYDLGTSYIERFLPDMYNHTSNYGAIALYYTGLERLRKGDAATGKTFIEDAYDRCSLDRIGHWLGLAPEDGEDPWVGQTFPVNYTLPLLETPSENHQLEAALIHQDRHQLMIICLLGSYRSNGPYEDFMQVFLGLQRHFGKIFAGIQVITAAEYNFDWLDSEHLATSKGLPIAILHDEADRVSESMGITSSPEVFLVDKQMKIICHSRLTEEVEMWNLVAQRIQLLCSPISDGAS